MYGTLEQLDDGRWQLRFTRTLRHPMDTVWRAISEPEHLAAWFPTTIEGERVAGAPLRFTFPADQAPPFEGEMIACEPPSLMELRWGPDIIRLELRPTPEGTELTLLDTLEELGKAARDGAGWHTCLDALLRSLDGAENAREAMNAWGDVHGHYVEDFGPEAAAIGPPEGFD
ncbi:MAG: SRPBCC domain-containing protein [Actinomycetota bacterium]|nr:SRPBCC domain-containing protein [Actinomycetota bacterium]